MSAASNQWPTWARAIARLRLPSDTGVGDTVHRLAGQPGRLIETTLKRYGICCGCADRRAKWNAKYPYPPPEESHGR